VVMARPMWPPAWEGRLVLGLEEGEGRNRRRRAYTDDGYAVEGVARHDVMTQLAVGRWLLLIAYCFYFGP
jgi:hypothetical protein